MHPRPPCARQGRARTARREAGVVSKNLVPLGEFYWLGHVHQGLHTPIIWRGLFDHVQQVFASAHRPRHTKRRHVFAGLITCGRCGCAYTAETKKGQYVYYHCTGHRGPCGNTYVREEELVSQFGRILQQVRIPSELAGKLATVLRESQADKVKFARTALLRLQQQQLLLCSKLDRVYEDRLRETIPEELWSAKSAELQEEYAACGPTWSGTRRPARRTRPRGCRFSNSRKPRIRRTLRRIRTNRRVWSERSYRTPRSIAETSRLLTLSRSTCSRGERKRS